jgi:hypothetical protein
MQKQISCLTLALFAFLLVASAANSISASNAYSSPKAVYGATATIDYPILAGDSVVVTRTINVTNPSGNLGITVIYVSVPASAASAAPSGTFPADSGVPLKDQGQVQVFGSGPWTVEYPASGENVLVPGGSSIRVTLTLTTETSQSNSKDADAYNFEVSVTDTSGANTVLSPITVYETSSQQVTVSNPTSLQQVARKPFDIAGETSQSGLPLNVSAYEGTSFDITISPSTFFTMSAPTLITITDSRGEDVGLLVSGNGTLWKDSSGGVLTPGASSVITVWQLTAATNKHHYSGSETLTVSGTVSPPPGNGTEVRIKVKNPEGTLVLIGKTYVNENGYYSLWFVLGGNQVHGWITGTYNVIATWQDSSTSPVVKATTHFKYSSQS